MEKITSKQEYIDNTGPDSPANVCFIHIGRCNFLKALLVRDHLGFRNTTVKRVDAVELTCRLCCHKSTYTEQGKVQVLRIAPIWCLTYWDHGNTQERTRISAIVKSDCDCL
jgi:hypothetical protein